MANKGIYGILAITTRIVRGWDLLYIRFHVLAGPTSNFAAHKYFIVTPGA